MAKDTKKSIAEASSEMYKLLEPFESADRTRIVNATLTLLGDLASYAAPGAGSGAAGGGAGGSTGGGGIPPTGSGLSAQRALAAQGARDYFNAKGPKGVSETLATAARFHELTQNGANPTAEDFKRIIADEARRGFTARNFWRDIGNARKAKFFNAGGGKTGGYPLSNVGQDYVDALPERDKAKGLKAQSGGRAGGARKRGKKKAGAAGSKPTK